MEYAPICTYVHVYVCTYVYKYVFICIYVYVYIHTHKRTHSHTHTRIYTLIVPCTYLYYKAMQFSVICIRKPSDSHITNPHLLVKFVNFLIHIFYSSACQFLKKGGVGVFANPNGSTPEESSTLFLASCLIL